MKPNYLKDRHIGLSEADRQEMLREIGAESIDQLIEQTMPKDIRISGLEDERMKGLEDALTEADHLESIAAMAEKNLPYKSLIGRGWYGTITPAVIQRNMLENPVWYISYTPYQAEVSQGRLEALFVFQTMISLRRSNGCCGGSDDDA